jgi:hypothetical protein
LPKYDQIDWDNAACRGVYTDLFYSVEEERSIMQYHYINALRSICSACPLWKECLTYAFENERYGVWGGLTSIERMGLKELGKNPNQTNRAIYDLKKYGITLDMIQECL